MWRGGPPSLYISVDSQADVDAAFAAAKEAGATVIWEPEATEWGNYRCRVLDLEGYEWSVATHRPGESSGDWSEDDWSDS